MDAYIDRFNVQKNVLAKMEMIGQEDKAIEILKKAVKEANEKSLSYHEYEYQMLLVEALIYKVFLTTNLFLNRSHLIQKNVNLSLQICFFFLFYAFLGRY